MWQIYTSICGHMISNILKIRDNHYVDKIIGRIPYTNPDTGKQMEQIRNEMNLYIQNAINENGNYR